MKRAEWGHEGFSLIELMAALAIITIAITGLIAMISTTTALQINTERGIAAKNEARKIMEMVKGYSCDEIVTNFGSEYGVSVSGFDADDEATGTVYVDISNPELLGVAVVIKWKVAEVQGAKRYGTYEVRRLIADGS